MLCLSPPPSRRSHPDPQPDLTWILPSLCRATLKTGQEVCLNPEAPMVKKIINKMLNKTVQTITDKK
eukprot:bmy_20165T0